MTFAAGFLAGVAFVVLCSLAVCVVALQLAKWNDDFEDFGR